MVQIWLMEFLVEVWVDGEFEGDDCCCGGCSWVWFFGLLLMMELFVVCYVGCRNGGVKVVYRE